MSEPSNGTMLAAIMFTDIAGYSALMEEDEDRTINLLKAHNETVLPLVHAAGGEVVDAIGDGLLVLFPSVRDAVTCAGSVHDAIDAHNRSAPAGMVFRLRIGIHLGEVRREAGRVFGNGINMAARVQPFALPGGICLSEDVYRQIANTHAGALRSIGRRSLRNITREVELYYLKTGHELDEGVEPSALLTTHSNAADPPPGQIPSPPTPAADGAHSADGTHNAVGDSRKPSEFDAIKERILREIEAHDVRQGRDPKAPDSLENRIESKVFSVVEKVMDKAITKFEQMPDEKKQKALNELEVHIGGEKHKPKKEKKEDDSERWQKLVFGLVAGVGFGLGRFVWGMNWMIWPMIIIGVLPFISGAADMLKYRARARVARRNRPKELERLVLAKAQALGGRLTVVQLASNSDLSLDDAQNVLNDMSTKGYVTQHVRDDGMVEYRFPLIGAGPEEP